MSQIRTLGSGATFPEVSKTQLEELRIALPTLVDQRRIANTLNGQLAVASHVALASDERLTAARALPMAGVVGLFGSAAARSWPRRALSEVVIGNGQYGTSEKSSPTELPGSHPVLGIGNIKAGSIDWTRLKFGQLSEEATRRYLLVAGDLLFVRTNSADLVGETAVFDSVREAVFASYLVRFRVNPKLADPRFVSTYINSPWGRHFIQQNLGRAIGQANVSASTMAEMPIPVPPLNVQREAMDKLASSKSGYLKLEELVKQEYEEIALMPAALLREAFNGD